MMDERERFERWFSEAHNRRQGEVSVADAENETGQNRYDDDERRMILDEWAVWRGCVEGHKNQLLAGEVTMQLFVRVLPRQVKEYLFYYARQYCLDLDALTEEIGEGK